MAAVGRGWRSERGRSARATWRSRARSRAFTLKQSLHTGNSPTHNPEDPKYKKAFFQSRPRAAAVQVLSQTLEDMLTLCVLAPALALLLLPYNATAYGLIVENRPGLEYYSLEKGLALGGYDPVSYFAEFGGIPIEGTAKFSLEHRGVTYHFVSDANRVAFGQTPERFEPLCGGWCAFSMSENNRILAEPTNFLLQDGKLLVFSKGGIFGENHRTTWNKTNPYQRATRANENWLAISGENARSIAAADKDRLNLAHYNIADNGLALGGFDPLSYHSDFGGVPLAGSELLATRYQGVMYRFATAENRTAFLVSPDRFEPAFGGWCALGMTTSEKASADPESFMIQDGRLLVFHKGLLNDARKKWAEGDMNAKLSTASENWKTLTTPLR